MMNVQYVFPTELHGASWPDQLVYKDVTWSRKILLCVLIVLFVLFLPVMYICLDLQVFRIWDFGSMARSEQV